MTQYLASRLLPIPPYKEQQRIVDKIKALLPVIQKYNYAQDAVNTLNEEIYSLLQKSILQEAIQGKLVPQVSSDEPASALLERIAAEKQQLAKEGKLKAKDGVTSIIFKGEDNKYYEQIGSKVLDISEEIPFDIPQYWSWVRFKNVAQILNGYAFESSKYVSDGYRVMRITNVQDGYIIDNDPKFYPLSSKNLINDYLLQEGDLLMSLTGNVGRVGILSGEFLPAALNQRVACIRTFIPEIKQFLFTFCKSALFVKDCITSSKGMAQKNMSTEWLKNHLIPIPPYSEQVEIISRLKRLNALL